jgi:hypothetical protein
MASRYLTSALVLLIKGVRSSVTATSTVSRRLRTS